MSETNRLSPMTTYYLRKLVDDRQEQLHRLLPGVTGSISLDLLMGKIYQQAETVSKRISMIEALVELHKKVNSSSSLGIEQKQELDQRLLRSLVIPSASAPKPPKPIVSSVQDCLALLNKLHQQARSYLGDLIGTKYLSETQPNSTWGQQFQIDIKGPITYQGRADESLRTEQIQQFESWIAAFSDRCCHIVVIPDLEDAPQQEALFERL